ncbi:MAG TPA: hypothetical protein VFB58_06445 [Chloroflexota bacterium]|nr:hypothetical protein [Chloroflexota bacterium]
MSWIEHPTPDNMETPEAAEMLQTAIEENPGEMSMRAAMLTAPGGEHLVRFIRRLHFSETALPRANKEMIATLVSSLNGCQY